MTGRIGGWSLSGIFLVALSSGCCCIDGGTMVGYDMVGDTCGGGIITGDCGSCTGSCGGGCGADFGCGGPLLGRPLFAGPLFGGYYARRCGYGDVGCNGCGSCAGDSCGCGGGCGGGCGNPYGYGPILGVLGLVRHALVCGFGCGPVYWDEWYSDPPLCHDPCDTGACVSDCSYGGCSTCGTSTGDEYMSYEGSEYAAPESSCPDGSCGAHHHPMPQPSVVQQMVPAEGEVVLSEAPTGSPVRRTAQGGQRIVRRTSQATGFSPAPSHRVASQPMRPATRPTRTVTSHPMTTQEMSTYPMYR